MSREQLDQWDYHDSYDDWIECDQCGGDGYMDDECECETVVDICSCATPTPRRCRTCHGKGGWTNETEE